MTLMETVDILGAIAGWLALIPLFTAYKREWKEKEVISVDEYKMLLKKVAAQNNLSPLDFHEDIDSVIMRLGVYSSHPWFSQARKVSKKFYDTFSGSTQDARYQQNLSNLETALEELGWRS